MSDSLSHLPNYSEELQEALGLRKNQLPPFIYQMRICGYPPGWLDDAKAETSGLAMYHKGGKGKYNRMIYSMEFTF